MFGAIIALVVLILVTPSLMGRPAVLTPPILIVGVPPTQTNLTLYVSASVQATLYDVITLNLTRLNAANESVGWNNVTETYTYGIELKVPFNQTYWRIHVWLEDEQHNYFEDNVTLRTYADPNNGYKLTFAFTFVDDKPPTVVTRVAPDDYRIPIPLRGTLP